MDIVEYGLTKTQLTRWLFSYSFNMCDILVGLWFRPEMEFGSIYIYVYIYIDYIGLHQRASRDENG
jgi:hypothetical protein